MTSTACNYNENTTKDDGSCIYEIGCDSCSGNEKKDGTGVLVDGDVDDNGVCDDTEFIPSTKDELISKLNSNSVGSTT